MIFPYTDLEVNEIAKTIIPSDGSESETSSNGSGRGAQGERHVPSGHVNQKMLKAELLSDRKSVALLKDQDFRVAFGPKPKPSAAMSGEEFKRLKNLTNAASKLTLMATNCMDMEVSYNYVDFLITNFIKN